MLGFLSGYLQEEGFASGRRLQACVADAAADRAAAGRGTVYIVLAALLLTALALAAGFRTDRSEQAAIRWLGWLLIVFLVLSSPHYPWYFLVLVPFLALRASATAWVLTTACVLFYDVVGNDGLPGLHRPHRRLHVGHPCGPRLRPVARAQAAIILFPRRNRMSAPSPAAAIDPRRYHRSVDENLGPVAARDPVCLYLETTNRCNLLCTTCPRTYRSARAARPT